MLLEGWPISEAAREVGVGRPGLSTYVNSDEVKARYDLELEQHKVAAKVSMASRSPLGLAERRRLGTVEEFSDRYFSWLECLDCGGHHETPAHVKELWQQWRGDELRTLVNLPVFHSKTWAEVVDITHGIIEDPNSQTIVVSKADELAGDIRRQCREPVDEPGDLRGWPQPRGGLGPVPV